MGGGGGVLIDTVVLAGGADRGELAATTGISYRPLLDVGGQPLIVRLLGALRASDQVGRIAVVAPEPVLAATADQKVDLRVLSGESFIDNLLSGVDALASPSMLIVTGDLPLLSVAAVDEFIDRSLAAEAEITYPIIPKEVCEARFPGGKRTWVRLRDGVFTGGNAVTLTRDFANRSRGLIAGLYASRKNPLKLASLLGFGFVIGLLCGRLTLADIERRASAIVSGRARAIICSHPELGFDVDKLSDLETARRALGA
jgi:GTP:adenosylcobinamide-phosphate guanylyltransferase